MVLYPQNGDRIVTTDSMAPLYPVVCKLTHCGTEHLLDFIAKDLHSRRMHGRTHAQADGQPENIVHTAVSVGWVPWVEVYNNSVPGTPAGFS